MPLNFYGDGPILAMLFCVRDQLGEQKLEITRRRCEVPDPGPQL